MSPLNFFAILAASMAPEAAKAVEGDTIHWPLFLALVVGATLCMALLGLFLGRKESWDIEDTPEEYQELQRAYEKTLRTMKDLEFDVQVGTLSLQEHGEIKAEYKKKAVRLRTALERLRLAAVRRIASGKSASISPEERQRIEALVRKARPGLKAAKEST